MSATMCAQNPCLARPSSPSLLLLARKCHLQSTALENKVSENCRWDGGSPKGFNGFAGRLPSLSHRSKKLTWTDRVGY